MKQMGNSLSNCTCGHAELQAGPLETDAFAGGSGRRALCDFVQSLVVKLGVALRVDGRSPLLRQKLAAHHCSS